MKLTILFFCLFFSPLSFADYNQTADFLCKTVFNQKAFIYADYFSQKFRTAISQSELEQIVQSLVEVSGKCKRIEQSKTSPQKAAYNFISENGNYLLLDFKIDDKNLITSLLARDIFIADTKISNWEDVEAQAKKLSGQISVTLQSDQGNGQSFQGNSMHPLGSGFKLYVLGTLVDAVKTGKFKWADLFPVTESWKSLPSGIMQTWPNGKSVSLLQYAENMIRISDNTATDHLLNILGRENIENQLLPMGNDFAEKNTPFLSTAEMFKLKWAAPQDLTEEYLRADKVEKRQMLATKISSIPLDQVGTNGVSMEQPSHITDIEWFGSTNNLCTAMIKLKNKDSNEALQILANNVPLIDVQGSNVWVYAGFKGGSEPGVLTATFLLKSKTQHWGCVSVAWHDSKKPINQWIMFDFARKVLKVSESYLK